MAFHGRFARVLLTVSMALVLVTIPLRVTLKGWRAELSLQSAFAKDGNGKGGGNGNGGGKDGRKRQRGGNGKGEKRQRIVGKVGRQECRPGWRQARQSEQR